MNKPPLNEILESKNCRYGLVSYFKSDIVIGASLREYGEWAQNEIDFLLKFIEPGDTVFDIGAFIGTHTLAFAKQVGNAGCVYAFEPNPIAFEVLALNVSQNALSNVKLEKAALSNKKSTINYDEFDWDITNPGATTLIEREGDKEHPPKSAIEITTRCLDEYHVETCRLIKIDVEMMEVNVIEGARKFLSSYRPYVYTECLSVDNGAKILSLMQEEGYSGFIHSETAYSSTNYGGNGSNFFGLAREVNLIFVPEEEESKFRKWACSLYELPAIITLDDLVLSMLKKPQYKDEILSKTNAAKVLGNDFWLNETDLQQINQQVNEKTDLVQSVTTQLTEKENVIQNLNQQLEEKEQVIQNLSKKNSELTDQKIKYEAEIEQKGQVLQTILSRLAKKQNEILTLENKNKEFDEQLNNQTVIANGFSSQLWEIKQSHAWNIVQLIWKLRLLLIPRGSWRARFLRSIYSGFHILKDDGVIEFLKTISRRLFGFTIKTKKSDDVSEEDLRKTTPVASLAHPDPVYIPTSLLEPHPPGVDDKGTSIHPDDRADLWERVSASMKYDDFVISISHDDYLTINYGVQMFIADEQNLFDTRKVSYIHLYPINGIDLADYGAINVVGLNIDSNHIGQYTKDDIVWLLDRLIVENHACLSLNIHHFKGWAFDTLFSVISTVHPDHLFFYVHDYFAICPQYNLLRNQREFCNAPPLDSNACTICMFSDARKIQLPLVIKLFSSFPFKIIAPSKITSILWKKALPNLGNELRIEPHIHLRETSNPLPTTNPKTMCIAYVGQAAPHKGWDNWRMLVDQLSSSEEYQLFHLGSWVGDYPEKFETVRVTPQNRSAMLDALRRNKIDVVFQGSIWPETFSYVLYEAIEAGCFILTTNQSGNVADYVSENNNGHAFETIPDMIDYLSNPNNLRNDLLKFRQTYPYAFLSERNETIVNQVKTANHSGIIK